MVVIVAPSHCNASIVHDFIAFPLTCTTQAPHCVVSHPTCVPVRPSVCLRKSTSNVRPSTSPRTARPFTIIDTPGIPLPSADRLALTPHCAERTFWIGQLSRVLNGTPDAHGGHGHRNF